MIMTDSTKTTTIGAKRPREASTDKTTTTARATKTTAVRALLAAESGASLAAICAATGWQPHSARALLSTMRKAGFTILRDAGAVAGEAVYRLVEAPRLETPTPGHAEEDRSRADHAGDDHSGAEQLGGNHPGAEPAAEPVPAQRRARSKKTGITESADPEARPTAAQPDPRPKTVGRKGRR